MWASLHGHSTFSLLDGISQPIDIIKTCVQLGIPAFGLTEHGNCSSAIKFLQAQKKYISSLPDGPEKEAAKAFKPILGQEFYLADSPKENSHLVVLAKNKEGWKQLIKASSEATRKENFYRRPRLTFEQIAKYSGNLIVINGHAGSNLFNCLWSNVSAAFNAETYADAKALVHDDWKKRVLETAGKFKEAFGSNFYIEIQNIDKDRLPCVLVANNILKWAAKQLNIRCVATADSHYPTQDRAIDQRVMLCSMMTTTLPKVRKALHYDEDIGLGGFFKSDKYYIPSPQEIIAINEEAEVKVSLEIAEECEVYDLSNKPIIPKFTLPDGYTSSDDYLRQLCRDGWKEKIVPQGFDKEKQKLYADRVKTELEVLQSAGLSDYFLLVKDIVDWVKDSGGLVGGGRGSVAGSLSAFLLGITAVDSIKYDLIFERFYNAGRNSPGRVSLPDVDMDIQASFREKVINYIKQKYGKEKVGKISTYGRLMGRSCLSEVLRVHDILSFDEVKRLTKFIPDEAAIAGDLEEMKEEEDQPSIILWSLQNNSKELSEWCTWNKSTSRCEGQLAEHFEQAMRLEGTYKSIGKHAAGVVIFPENVEDRLPVIYDGDGDCQIAVDMHDIEYDGGVKFDVLGSRVYDCIADAAFDICSNFLKDGC